MTRRPDLAELGAIFLGGMAGALARVWLSEHLFTGGGRWPWAIFLINVAGAALLGWIVTRSQAGRSRSAYLRPLVGTGFCGALTTFSTMQLELLTMLDAGHVGLALGYAAASIVAGYAAVWAVSELVRRPRSPA